MIVTLQEALNYLELDTADTESSETANITEFLKAAEDLVLKYLNRSIESTEYSEDIDGDDTNSINVKNYPIDSEAELTVTITDNNVSSEVDNTDLKIDYNSGIIYYPNNIFPEGIMNINVVYTAGYAAENIPSVVKIAIKTLLKILWEKKDQNAQGAIDYHSGDSIVKFDNNIIPDDVRRMLSSVKRYSFK